MNQEFQIDIHPAATFGEGVFIDHGTGIVVGETAIVGDDVSMLHRVTLGGSGIQTDQRHPKVGPLVFRHSTLLPPPTPPPSVDARPDTALPSVLMRWHMKEPILPLAESPCLPCMLRSVSRGSVASGFKSSRACRLASLSPRAVCCDHTPYMITPYFFAGTPSEQTCPVARDSSAGST